MRVTLERAGDRAIAPGTSRRNPSDTGLPWTIVAHTGEDLGDPGGTRRTIWTAGLLLLGSLALVGTWVIGRAVSRVWQSRACNPTLSPRFPTNSGRHSHRCAPRSVPTAAISPTRPGTQLAFLGSGDRRTRTGQLGIIPATGGPERILLDSAWEPQARLGTLGWSRDGRHLFFANREKPGAPMEFSRLPIDGGEPAKIGVGIVGQLKGPSLSADGRRLAYTAVESKPPEVWMFENLLPVRTDGRK